MKNIFALTKRDQRVVIAIVVMLVAASLLRHYLNPRSEPAPPTSTSTLSPTATPHPPAEEQDVNDAPER
ncbi:MAG: hypothetical protein ABR514_07435 [Chthoniobacterales bacterium]